MNFDFKTISIGSFAALALLAAPLAMTQVHAQGRGEGGGRGTHRGARLEQLNLTDAQSAQIESIHANSRSAMEALLTAEQRATLESSDSEGRRAWKALDLTDAQRTEARAIREDSRGQIQGVLTEDQRQQLAQAGGGRGHGRGRGHGGGHNLERLNLTDDQSAQIEAIRDTTRSQMQAVLTAEQRATLESSSESGGRRDFRGLDLSEDQRSQLEALRETSREQIQGVLTEEQRQQMEENRSERGERGERRNRQ